MSGSNPTAALNAWYATYRHLTKVHEFVPKVTSVLIGDDLDQSNPCSICESKNCKNVMFGMECSKICSIGPDNDITSCSITRSANTGSTIVIILLFLFIIPFTVFMFYKYRQFLPRPKTDKVTSGPFKIVLINDMILVQGTGSEAMSPRIRWNCFCELRSPRKIFTKSKIQWRKNFTSYGNYTGSTARNRLSKKHIR